MKTIVLTGGGTAGHVTPNLALIPALKKEGWQIKYIGSKTGIEKELIEKAGIEYHGIASGKLRRYFSKENFTDMFKVVKGVSQASSVLGKLKPDVVFSKGGFVAVPVVFAAKMKGIPVIVHESDITPGLANKLAVPFAKTVCTTFPETVKYIKGGKGICTGTPIREGLFNGVKEKGLTYCGFTSEKPVIMMMGGSLGSVKINTCLRNCLEELLKEFQLVHICGKGNVDKSLVNKKGYCQFEYVSEELPHIFAMTDLIISRAGSNSISEFLALKKPMLLIPLSANASRGDQILNAESFKKRGFAQVLEEESLTKSNLLTGIKNLYNDRDEYISKMADNEKTDGVAAVMNCIRKVVY